MKPANNIPQSVEDILTTHRRGFLRNAGMLLVSLGAGGDVLVRTAEAQTGGASYKDPDYHQLDSWVVVHADNTATFYVGKTDCGQGTATGFRQLMSDELDIAFDKTTCVMGSTENTVDQGGSGGSTAMERDAWPMRRAAAEARRVLLSMGSAKLGVPVDQLTVSDAVISVKADPSKQVTYGELIGGKKFNVTLTGDNINAVTGQAKVKAVQEHKYTGKPFPRADIPAKVNATQKWAVDVKPAGMVHARNVKPPYVGSKLTAIDESSVKDLPGFIRVVSKGNYVAVVCEREEQAITAARKLKTTWEKPATAPFPKSEDLFNYMRSAKASSSSNPVVVGDPNAAFAGAAKVVEAEYEIPFQGHTAIAGAHATADPSNGQMTIYSNDMKSYGMRRGVATFLGMPQDKVRVVWLEGPQGYGRTAADDAGCEAAWIAKEIGRPVRIQWMRDEETAWDTKGPAYVIKARGALNAQGELIGYEYAARACDQNHVGYNEPDTVLIAQLMGSRKEPARGGVDMPSDSYAVPNRRMTGEVVGLPLLWETPLRTGNLRDPNGPQTTFGAESFIDEMAVAAKADPVAFRMKLLTASSKDNATFHRARSIAVLKAAAEKSGWDARPSPKGRGTGTILTGRGVAYSFRGNTVVALVAEVEVNRQTGHVWAKRLVCAHDCGLIVNPLGLQRAIEGGMLYTLSRALHEEVQFDTEKVTSVDWISHPSLRHADVPETIDVVLVNGDPNPDRPDLPPYGAGEMGGKPMLAAIANAIHDATGVRIRRVPFRDARVLAALKAASV
jgi:CO/xanthine dehydrogenase Mo-binding subunit